MDTLTLNSYAKLNLCLKVLNKRADSYHNINTIFERISLSDEINLKSTDDGKIKVICASDELPRDHKRNLAYRSAKLLQDSYGVKKGVRIKIIKHIPVGSGMGGGSSNAAYTLMGLNRLWGLNLKRDTLASLAGEIGSDAAFFIYDTPFAHGTSRGEKIKPLPPPGGTVLWHVLVVPRISVSTPLIYGLWDKASHGAPRAAALGPERLEGLTRKESDVKILNLALRKNEPFRLKPVLFNSLESITAGLHREVRLAKEELFNLGLELVLMSGSGPTVFGVVSSRKEALILFRQLRKKGRQWRVFVCKTI